MPVSVAWRRQEGALSAKKQEYIERLDRIEEGCSLVSAMLASGELKVAR